MCGEAGYIISPEAEAAILDFFRVELLTGGTNLGNGRFVYNTFSGLRKVQAVRLMKSPDRTPETLAQFTLEDIQTYVGGYRGK